MTTSYGCKPAFRLRSLLLSFMVWCAVADCGGAEIEPSLMANERAALQQYLQGLRSGAGSSPEQVNRFAEGSWPQLQLAIQAYLDLPDPVQPHTHDAFQRLLVRMAAPYRDPLPLLELYAPSFLTWLSETPNGNSDATEIRSRLMDRLAASEIAYVANEIAVSLCPTGSLLQLADALERRETAIALDGLEAWNRRLRVRREDRPLADPARALERIRREILKPPNPDALHDEAILREGLIFLSYWPKHTSEKAAEAIRQWLVSDDPVKVEAALRAQRRNHVGMDLLPQILQRFPENRKLWRLALQNMGEVSDVTEYDFADELRRIWPRAKSMGVDMRYWTLYAMSLHPHGNQAAALETLQEVPLDELDLNVILALLNDASETDKRKAVSRILKDPAGQGAEEAFRFAHAQNLTGYHTEALSVLHDARQPWIARTTSMRYLELAPAEIRFELLPYLRHSYDDLRLTAIMLYRKTEGFSPEDLNAVGGAMAQVYLQDPSPGLQQEALYTLAKWEHPMAEELFEEVLAKHPAPDLTEPVPLDQTDAYWDYAKRLMGLYGLAKLGHESALQEMREIFEKGGPQRAVDVTLLLSDLGQCPDWVEPILNHEDLVVKAHIVDLIAHHGSPAQVHQMQHYFLSRPFWMRFHQVGLPDHFIMGMAGILSGGHGHCASHDHAPTLLIEPHQHMNGNRHPHDHKVDIQDRNQTDDHAHPHDHGHDHTGHRHDHDHDHNHSHTHTQNDHDHDHNHSDHHHKPEDFYNHAH